MKNISGKVVAITGAALGMGRLTADKFAADGAKLALLDIKQDQLDQAVNEINNKGGSAKGYICDVSNRAQVYEVFKQIANDLGPVDVLFNNAGVVFGGPLCEVDDDKLEKTIQINLIAHMWTMKAVLPNMMARNDGHIINFASAAGLVGVPNLVAYCASKSGVIGMTESLRQEVIESGRTGIKFTVIEPSYVATGMFAGVKPPLLSPWLSPAKMAETIYEAYLNDKVFVRMPVVVKFVPLLKAILSTPLFDFMAGALKMRQSMRQWTGRQE